MKREDEVRLLLERMVPDGCLVTHWLIVIESTDGEARNLHLATSDGMTPWMTYGMLEAAHDVATTLGTSEENEEEN